LNHEQLWAPWRLGYIKGEKVAPPEPASEPQWLDGADRACFICRSVAEDLDRENLLVLRGELAVTILNRFPYNNGHLLVAPKRHAGRLDELTAGEHSELMAALSQMILRLEERMNAEGFNVGLNLGRLAGAGLPGHLHWHIVPRWNGDTNFMPTLAGIKVIPQSLESLWELLAPSGNSAEASRPS